MEKYFQDTIRMFLLFMRKIIKVDEGFAYICFYSQKQTLKARINMIRVKRRRLIFGWSCFKIQHLSTSSRWGSVTIASISKNSNWQVSINLRQSLSQTCHESHQSIRPSTEAGAAGISIIFDANYGYSKRYVGGWKLCVAEVRLRSARGSGGVWMRGGKKGKEGEIERSVNGKRRKLMHSLCKTAEARRC